MEQKEITVSLRVYKQQSELDSAETALLNAARQALPNAYAPYSNFKVGAAVLLANGKTITGTNQENAAFPVGICAEGTALSAASSLYPDVAVTAIAVTVKSDKKI